MNRATRAYLLELRTDPRFAGLMSEINKGIPKIPTFNPEQDNTDQWKHDSGIRTGYEICMSHLNMEINDE